MNYTENYNLKKQELTDPSDIRINGENADAIDALIHDIHEDGGDIKISFSDDDLDTDITSFSTYLGKIVSGIPLAKFIRDFIAGMQYVLHVGNIKNDLLATESGYVLDARQGKALNDKINQRIDLSGVFGMQVRGSNATNNLAFRVFKNSENTAWTQETINADNTTLTISKKEAGESTDTVVTTLYSAGNIVKVKAYSYEYTCEANSPVNITGSQFGVSTPSGYLAIGAVAYFTGSQHILIYRLIATNTGSNPIMTLRNVSNVSITTTATVYIMYIKSTSKAAE